MTHAPDGQPLDPDDLGLPSLGSLLVQAAVTVAAWALLIGLGAIVYLLAR